MLLCIQAHHPKSIEGLHPHQTMAERKRNMLATAQPSPHTASRYVVQSEQQDAARRSVWYKYTLKDNVRRQPTFLYGLFGRQRGSILAVRSPAGRSIRMPTVPGSRVPTVPSYRVHTVHCPLVPTVPSPPVPTVLSSPTIVSIPSSHPQSTGFTTRFPLHGSPLHPAFAPASSLPFLDSPCSPDFSVSSSVPSALFSPRSPSSLVILPQPSYPSPFYSSSQVPHHPIPALAILPQPSYFSLSLLQPSSSSPSCPSPRHPTPALKSLTILFQPSSSFPSPRLLAPVFGVLPTPPSFPLLNIPDFVLNIAFGSVVYPSVT
ncbi:vegetative cell wall protein gp1-like [Sander lucioperca]|uniref:vegetative cell wall protein gp1-like n=1 Tax=Sander lucioperca TaxID=283035 RepID=UPI0016536EF1|nr:vegetative cell wall protein gp1-like [Sander lucioperca]